MRNPLREALEVFSDPLCVKFEDDRYDYDARRFVAIGMVGNRLLSVVLTERDIDGKKQSGSSRRARLNLMSKERITRVTLGEARKLPRSDWERVDAMTEEELHQDALDDPNNPPWPEEMLARARRVPEVRAIRTALGLTQEEFARAYEISVYSIRDWEQRRTRPDSSAQTLLRVIERQPDMVREALAS